MIRHIRGELATVCEGAVVVDVGGVGYEVHVAEPLLDVLADRGVGAHVELATYHAEGGGPSGNAPRLVGFATEAERRFFELLLSVHNMGPMAAIRALVLPMPTIAKAIELGDARTLQTLPGVGKQRARDMISKLQGRMGEFIEGLEEVRQTPAGDELTVEALEVLVQIGLARGDALERIKAVREASPELSSADEIVRAVFRRK
ncbi:MAG TPA: Holliday junction branch migration protein RuvA [Armatimonadota bacterium]|nr:Holliday junction branch migration protein RuvA [Armatimonadota bacterium]